MSEKENPLEDAVELGYKAAENGKNLDEIKKEVGLA